MENAHSDPAAVVQRQLDAYNARDVEALLAIYAEDAEIYEHPNTLLGRGSADLRARYTVRFQEPHLHAQVHHRMVMGSMVVDHETVMRDFPEGQGTVDLVMIYEVRAGRIIKSWALSGPKRLSA